MSKLCPQCGNRFDDATSFCPYDRFTLRPEAGDGELVGSVIADRYLIIDKLGQGGMGRVYLARHVMLDEHAAVKVLPPAVAGDADAIARFNRGAKNAFAIKNQHVAQIYDYGETGDGVLYLAMEYVPGRTLGALLEQSGPLTPWRAAALAAQIADGLDAAHALGIVHRDLAPDNILVTAGPHGSEVVKLVDFGISKSVRGDAPQVTEPGLVAGKYEFMSPEQVTAGEIDHRSDVYTLGLVVFMMLTGKLPFPGETAEHAMLMRLKEPPRRLVEMLPDADWPSGLQQVLDEALAREPGDRYASAGEFARALSAATAPGGTAGRAAAREEEGEEKEPRRGLRPALIGGGLALVGVLIATVTLWPPRATLPPRESMGVLPLDVSPTSVELDTVISGPAPSDGAALAAATGPDTATGDLTPRAPSASKEAKEPPPAPAARRATPRKRPASPPRDPRPAVSPEMEAPAPRPPAEESQPTASIPLEGLSGELSRDSSAAVAAGPGAAGGLGAPAERDPGAELFGFDELLTSQSTGESAQLVLDSLKSLVPRLRTEKDKAQAEIYRAEAYGILGRYDEACATLAAVRPRAATATQRARIQLWYDRGVCQP